VSQPLKRGLHGADAINIAVNQSVAASLTFNQSKSSSGEFIAHAGAAQVYDRGQVLLTLQRG